ncbi:unnamed protein product [Prorocentrum cordatum]|uniref:Uncharacterized protein n=1 Tax=Prorocentrum cordatum TaxID=2364126 RepID=A0ABN9WFK1_9DINO|nr:unnamed protein product [Polarella glacialis]
MFRSHISFGSLAASALVTAVDLQSGRVGLAPRGNPRAESTEEFCAPRAVCQDSASQIYYPPRNVCEETPTAGGTSSWCWTKGPGLGPASGTPPCRPSSVPARWAE